MSDDDDPTLFDPVTPYDGGTSSGWFGSAGSHERAVRRDANGATKGVQQTLLRMLDERRWNGLTVAEARNILPEHHGSVSGALSNLHLAEKIGCLVERRNRCHIYIGNDYIDGRETRQQGRRGTGATTP